MDKFFMKAAIKEAEKCFLTGDVPVGAVIVKDGEIIATGRNTRERDNNPLGHAEINAIIKASEKLCSWHLDECTIYVTLEPCPMCAGAILQARLSKVVFGAYDEKSGAVGSKFNLYYDFKHTHNVLFTGGVLEEECLKPIKSFFDNKR